MLLIEKQGGHGLIRIRDIKRNLSEIVPDTNKVSIEEISLDLERERMVIKLSGSPGIDEGAVKSHLEKILKLRVSLDYPEKHQKEKLLSLLNGSVPYVKDVEIRNSGVTLVVVGEFAKDRVEGKLASLKRELIDIFGKIPSFHIEVIEDVSVEERKIVQKVPVRKAISYSGGGEVIFGRTPRRTIHPPSSIPEPGVEVSVKGKVFKMDLNGKKNVLNLYITDGVDSIMGKIFDKDIEAALSSVEIGDVVVMTGSLSKDNDGEPIVLVKGLLKLDERRKDNSPEKRVELHAHSKFSDLDAIMDVEEYVKRAKEWGFSAVAITDHGNVQAIPYFYEVARKYGIKPIFGMEGYMINDAEPILHNYSGDDEIFETKFVVVDLETTGLDPVYDEIVEIGAVKIENGEIVDEYHTMVKPKKEMSRESIRITGITRDMLEEGEPIEKVIPKFLEFLENTILVAHNANFDYGFLRYWISQVTGKNWENPYIDTLGLSKALLKMSSYSLDKIASKLKIGIFQHHRALDDAKATAQIFLKLLQMLKVMGITKISDIEKVRSEIDFKSLKPYHFTILVKNKEGLKNLYILVSKSHVEFFHSVPRIPRSLLIDHRKGLLIGTACISGELAKAFLEHASDEELEEIAKFYDYIEIMPLSVARLEDEEREIPEERLKEMYRKFYEIGKKLNIPVVMTGDVHFLDPEDSKGRLALLAPQNRKKQSIAPLHFRATDEMMEEAMKIFEDEEIAYEIVVKNTRKIAEMIEEVIPVEKRLHPPVIEKAEEIIRDMAWKKAKEVYGDPLPSIVEERLNKELNAIITHGYSVLYLIAKRLVDKSKEDGYVVGSRGSVGSSLVAHLLGITEVNPLPPHYVCPKCKYSEFVEEDTFGAGFDLPNKECPRCGTLMKKDGHDIPFEVFMGFEGDKIPDIDLNFSGEYQDKAHRYIEELFGRDHVFRAGTISTIAERSAMGFVKSYEEKARVKLRKAEKERLMIKITGVKRTTGQHPGGLMIIPKDKSVYDFTPIQYPANDRSTGVFTTHFAYETIHDDLVKIDALGHDDPTFMKFLKDLTGMDPMSVPMDDPETLAIFSSVEPLGVNPDELGTDVGTYGIPEFGTEFVRGMLRETRPKTFSELVRISGLSHGTDVWLNNARDWIRKGYATLAEVISCRDDIMNYLIHKGMEPSLAFKIMENVRKGKGISEEEEKMMKKLKVPNWFIESCKRIKYLFPKAHAVAYVSMAYRIAYFKVHYPLSFYSAYFTIKGDQFDPETILAGEKAIKERLSELKSMTKKDVQDKNEEAILEVALEMLLRGFSFLRPDIFKSEAKVFLVEGNSLRIPFNKLPGLGDSVAESIVRAREEKPFTSMEDLLKRTKVNRTQLEMMKRMRVLGNLPDTEQFSLF